MQNDNYRPMPDSNISVASRIREALFVIWLLIIAMLFLALWTYEPTDSNFLNNDITKIHNSIGPIGARVSDMMFSYFGFCAYILLILLAVCGYFCFIKLNKIKWYDFNYDLVAIKTLGFNFLVISTCTLVSASIFSGDMESKGGGQVGAFLLMLFRDYLGYDGTVIFMFALLCSGFIFFTGISAEKILYFVGSCIFNTLNVFVVAFRKVYEFFHVKNEFETHDADEVKATNKFAEEQNNAAIANSKQPNVVQSDKVVQPNGVVEHRFSFNDDTANTSNTTSVNTSNENNVANNAQEATSASQPATPVINKSALNSPFVDASAISNSENTPISNSNVQTTSNPVANTNKEEHETQNQVNTKILEPNENIATNQTKSLVDLDNLNIGTTARHAPSSVSVDVKDPDLMKNNTTTNVAEKSNSANNVASNQNYTPNPGKVSTFVLKNEPQTDDANLRIPGLSAYDNATNALNNNAASNAVVDNKAQEKSEQEEIEQTINFAELDKLVDDSKDNTPYIGSDNTKKTTVSTQVLTSKPNKGENYNLNLNQGAIDSWNEEVKQKEVQANLEAQKEAQRQAQLAQQAEQKQAQFESQVKAATAPTGIEPTGLSSYVAPSFEPEQKEQESSKPQISLVSDINDNSPSNVIDFESIQQANAKTTEDFGVVPNFFTPVDENSNANLNNYPVNDKQPISNEISNTNVLSGQKHYDSHSPMSNVLPSNNNAPVDYSVPNSTGMRFVDYSSELPDSMTFNAGQYESDGSPLTKFPSLDIFAPPKPQEKVAISTLENMCDKIDDCLANLKIKAHVARNEDGSRIYECGPVITRYMIALENGKGSKISNMSTDIGRLLGGATVRVIEVIPGMPYVGIEIPNAVRQSINVRELFAGDAFVNSKAILPICLGRDITGAPVVFDLAAAPHLLVAGTTGSGKSVGINTMLVSLLLKHTPDDLRLIIVDPKAIEFKPYHDIPHLLTPIITDMNQTPSALRWAVQEMERRYKLLGVFGVRNIEGFNDRIRESLAKNIIFKDPLWRPSDSMDSQAPGLKTLPYIVFIIDEFADLILGMKKESGDIEGMISRLAAKARACGIHLILATQSPRAEVIRGSIRANFPSQIAFKVKSSMESHIIIDEGGAEKLLGRGDMLIKFNDGSGLTRRAHGGFISDDEIGAFTAAWRMRGKPEYVDEVTKVELTEETAIPGEHVPSNNRGNDALYDDVVEFVRDLKQRNRQFSVSLLQQHFGIGYNRASRITQILQDNGIVSEQIGAAKVRSILID